MMDKKQEVVREESEEAKYLASSSQDASRVSHSPFASSQVGTRSPGSSRSDSPDLASFTRTKIVNDHVLRAHFRRQKQQLNDLVIASATSTLAGGNLYSAGATGLPLPQPPVDHFQAALYQQKLQTMAAASLVQFGELANVPPTTSPNFQDDERASMIAAKLPSIEVTLSDSSSTEKEDVQQQDRDGSNKYEEDFEAQDHREGEDSPKVFEPFPVKLYRIIHEAHKENWDDIVSFFPHGRGFVIHKPRVFVSEIMPKYFTTSRMSSFQRQLNLYGFKRITEGKDMGGYCHPFFINGQPNLLRKIKRKKNYKKSTRGFAGYGPMATTLVDPVMASLFSQDPVQASLLREQATILQMSREIARQRQEQAHALAMMQLQTGDD